jgi:hypothetical protein
LHYLGGIAFILRPHDAGVIAEGSLQRCVGPFPQLVAITEEKRGFGKLPSLAEPPQKIRGNDGLSSACREREQHARR